MKQSREDETEFSGKRQKTKSCDLKQRKSKEDKLCCGVFIKGKDLMYTCVSYVFKIAKSVKQSEGTCREINGGSS